MTPKSLALAGMAAFALGTAVAMAFPALAGTPDKIPLRPAADTTGDKQAAGAKAKQRKLAKQDQGKVAALNAREHRKTAELNRKQYAAHRAARAKTTRTASKD